MFPHVDLDILTDQVTAVRRKNVNPETQMRQFLLAFKDNHTFQDAFDQLDEDVKTKIVKFRDGSSADTVIGSAGFHLPPSPRAKHHFQPLDLLRSLFHHPHGQKKPHEIAAVARDHGGGNAPVIYEDIDQKKIMKVKPMTIIYFRRSYLLMT